MFVSGPETSLVMRGMPEKYSKFAYSSRYGFSINSDASGFDNEAHDSMVAFSDDGLHYRTREHCVTACLAGNILYSLWHPFADVTVHTWLIPLDTWHIRVHKIMSPRKLLTIEGGFAVPRSDLERDQFDVGEHSANVTVASSGDFSGILDLSESSRRTARVHAPHGNTNLMCGRTSVPQLLGTVEANVPVVWAAAVLAGPDATSMRSVWRTAPAKPDLQKIEELFHSKGITVAVCKSHSS